MKAKFLLLSAGIAFLSIAAYVTAATVNPAAIAQNNNATTVGNQNATITETAGTLDCEAVASQLGGRAIPNPTGVCDVAVPRPSVQVQDNSSGINLSQLLVINPLFEFTEIPRVNITGTGEAGNNNTNNTSESTNQTMTTEPASERTLVYGFAEFATQEHELPLTIRLLSNSSWEVVAVHNHVSMEEPKMIFIHATGISDIDTLTSEAKNVLDTLQSRAEREQQVSSASTTTAAANSDQNATSPSIE